MVAENDKVLEAIDRWKKRIIAAFLLLAVVLAAIALLILESSVILKAWHLEYASKKGAAPTIFLSVRAGDYVAHLRRAEGGRNFAMCGVLSDIGREPRRQPDFARRGPDQSVVREPPAAAWWV